MFAQPQVAFADFRSLPSSSVILQPPTHLLSAENGTSELCSTKDQWSSDETKATFAACLLQVLREDQFPLISQRCRLDGNENKFFGLKLCLTILVTDDGAIERQLVGLRNKDVWVVRTDHQTCDVFIGKSTLSDVTVY